MKKPCLIDNSLVAADFSFDVFPRLIDSYINALCMSGISYFEIDRRTLAQMDADSKTDNLIFRITDSKDFTITDVFEFRYVVLPLALSSDIDRIKSPVILEIPCGSRTSLFDIITVLSMHLDLKKIEMLRVSGNIDYTPEEFGSFISRYHHRFTLPIDICARNGKLTAVSDTITAYAAGTDSITLRLGEPGDFTSYDEFAFSLLKMYGVTLCKDFITGYCAASAIASRLFKNNEGTRTPYKASFLFNRTGIINIDSQPKLYQYIPAVKQQPTDKKLLREKIWSLGIEDDIAEEILEVISDCIPEMSNLSILPSGKKIIM